MPYQGISSWHLAASVACLLIFIMVLLHVFFQSLRVSDRFTGCQLKKAKLHPLINGTGLPDRRHAANTPTLILKWLAQPLAALPDFWRILSFPLVGPVSLRNSSEVSGRRNSGRHPPNWTFCLGPHQAPLNPRLSLSGK